MPVCMVRGCNTSSRNKTDDIMLHSFPPDKESVKQWLMQMKQTFDDLDGFVEKIVSSTRGTYRICSLHFTPDMYELRGFLPFLKKKGAVPTVFPECPPIKISRGRKSIAEQRIAAGMFQPEDVTSYPSAVPNIFPECPPIKFSRGRKRIAEQRIVEGMFQPEDVTSYPLQDFPELSLKQHSIQMSTPSFETMLALQQSEPTFPRKRRYRPRAIRTIGTITGFFPGQVHKSTQCDIPARTKDKSFQIQINPTCRSVGIQCDISNSAWITNKNNNINSCWNVE